MKVASRSAASMMFLREHANSLEAELGVPQEYIKRGVYLLRGPLGALSRAIGFR